MQGLAFLGSCCFVNRAALHNHTSPCVDWKLRQGGLSGTPWDLNPGLLLLRLPWLVEIIHFPACHVTGH